MYCTGVASRVVLHIGAAKTGTTFLQAVLFRNKDTLEAQGILVPGDTRRDHGRAASGIRKGPSSKKFAEWERLVALAHQWPGTVVISNEWLSMAPRASARRALELLGDTETHVVFTTRDFIDQIPSAWQETLKLGVSTTLEGFIESLDGTDSHSEVLPDVAAMRLRWKWSVLDPAEVLPRWCANVPPERVHVVTVPSKSAGVGWLWQRFAAVLGIDPESCDTDVPHVRQSMGVESARLLQEVGPTLRSAVGGDEGFGQQAFPWVLSYFSHELLVPRGGHPIAMSPSAFASVRERSHQTIERLTAAGYDIVGDLEDLTSSSTPADARHPSDVSDRELLDLSLPLLGELLGRVRQEYLRASEAPDAHIDVAVTGGNGRE